MKKLYLSENLQYLRKERHQTQEQLALEVGVNKSAISNYETNQRLPERDVLLSLADKLSITVDELLYVDLCHLGVPNSGSVTDELSKSIDEYTDEINKLIINGIKIKMNGK